MKAINLINPLNVPIPPARDVPNLYSRERLSGVKEVNKNAWPVIPPQEDGGNVLILSIGNSGII